MPNINIKITADNSNATANLKAVKNEFDGLENSVNSTSNSLNALNFTKLSFLANYVLPQLVSGVASVASKFVELGDTYALMEGRLSLVSASSDELRGNFEALFTISQTSAQSLEATASLFGTLKTATDGLAVSSKDILSLTDTISKTLVISGATAQASSAALTQLGQAFGAGALRGEELNSILEQTPALAQAIAQGLDVSIGQLKQLGSEGKLTAEAVFNALQSQSDVIDEKFAKMPLTISNARQQISNTLLMLVGDFDSITGATENMAKALSGISTWISTNRGGIVEFGSDVFASFQAIGSAIILVVNGVREGAVSATLIVAKAINALNTPINDFINNVFARIEIVLNAVNSLIGADSVSFGEVNIGVMDLSGLEAEYNAVKNQNDEIIASIKQQVKDIAEVKTQVGQAGTISEVKNEPKAVVQKVEQKAVKKALVQVRHKTPIKQN